MTPLEVNRPEGRARSARTCRLCGTGVEDERHVLLECSAYDNIRPELWALGVEEASATMQAMGVNDQPGLAQLVLDVGAT